MSSMYNGSICKICADSNRAPCSSFKVLCIGNICSGCLGVLAAELYTGLDDVSKCRPL